MSKCGIISVINICGSCALCRIPSSCNRQLVRKIEKSLSFRVGSRETLKYPEGNVDLFRQRQTLIEISASMLWLLLRTRCGFKCRNVGTVLKLARGRNVLSFAGFVPVCWRQKSSTELQITPLCSGLVLSNTKKELRRGQEEC